MFSLFFFISALTAGNREPSPAQVAFRPQAAVVEHAAGNGWEPVETKDGVTCYARIAPLGNSRALYLRFENNSGQRANVSWEVTFPDRGAALKTGTLTLGTGLTSEDWRNSEGTKLVVIHFPPGDDALLPYITFSVSRENA